MWPFDAILETRAAILEIRAYAKLLAKADIHIIRTLRELKTMSAETDAAVAALNASVDRILSKMAGMGDVAPITAERDAALADLQALKDAMAANQAKLDAA